MADGFQSFRNRHRAKVLTVLENAVAKSFHVGWDRHRNNRRASESAVANCCHARGNLCTENAAVPKGTGANIGNTIFKNDFSDLAAFIIPWLFSGTGEIWHSPLAGDGQCTCFCQIPAKPSCKRPLCNGYVGSRVIWRDVAFWITGDIMAGTVHHLFLGDCPPPMDFASVVSGADISFSNNYPRITCLKHDYGMGIIVYPQNISSFYIFICKLTCCIHSGWQAAECRVAQYKGKGHASHGADILTVKGSALPVIISF